MSRLSLNGDDWHVRGFLDEAWRKDGVVARDLGSTTPQDRRWYRASVPGSVAHDLIRAGALPDLHGVTVVGTADDADARRDPHGFGVAEGAGAVLPNVAAMEWVPQRSWVYRKDVHVPASLQGGRVRLAFDGLDYAADVFLNGEPLGSHRSQFVPARFEVGDRLAYGASNRIAVALAPAPDLPSQHGRTSDVREHRTRMSYGWDFCPRLPHLGIWDDAYLEVTGSARLEDVWVRPTLADDLRSAVARVALEASSTEARDVEIDVRIRLDGETVAEANALRTLEVGTARVVLELPLDRPALWWPNGHGAQPLYEAEVRLGDSDRRTVAFGVRSLAWAANDTPAPGARPYTVVVNGTRVYLNGWNWVPIDLLYGVPRPAKLQRLLELARRAHVTLLRVNGVGLIERRAFYDLCDRHGILVWQEFVQSSSSVDRTPATDPAYLERMRAEAEAIVPQRRNHPSLAIWCGGNELEDAGFLPLKGDEPVLALLCDTVRRLDPDRLWLPTSATGPMPFCGIHTATHDPHAMHDVHGPWHHQGLTGQYVLFNRSRSLLHSELGAEGLAHLRTIHRTVPEAHRWPPAPDDPAWAGAESSTWLRPDAWAEAFGDVHDLPTLVRATQALQAEGVRYAVEANRRRKFENSGSLPWMFSEPWPQPAGTAAVDWYARPKPVYHAVARAYAPVAVTARLETQAWGHRDAFEAQVWIANACDALAGATLEARLVGMDGRACHCAERTVPVAGNAASHALDFRAPLEGVAPVFFLDLRLTGAAGEPLAANRYALSRAQDLAPFLTMPPTTLEGRAAPGGAELTNAGDHAALFVWLEDTRPLDELPDGIVGDNHLCLLPGETRAISVSGDGGAWRASGWNTNEVVIDVAGGA